ncbi:N-acylglucosamine 2-epimerase [Stutzerimonas nosocomialis]|nr:AGE family epimerase/isomerase [Stutzerimonas nosocomialis]TLX56020.1 N-acylglucosamine 2-epimerase [Stutzerimonas nosocomialis]
MLPCATFNPRCLPMSDLPRSVSDATPSSPLDALLRHFHRVIVPLWLGPGWNARLELPYEALDAEQRPLPAQRYRAMACARQLFLFASLIDQPDVPQARERAARLFASLQRHFYDAHNGGWFYSIDAEGAPLDRRKDLYTHAFVIFACAHYRARVEDPQADSVLQTALTLVRERFADGQGLYEAQLGEDWSPLGSGPLQNPLMHLTEAFLATLALRDDALTRDALLALVNAMQARFVDPATGVVLEKPLGAADNWFEPGHQFEWFFLLHGSPLLAATALHASLERAFEFALAHGLDANSGAVSAMLAADGSLLDGTQRIWAQAEYLRALALRGTEPQVLNERLGRFAERFLHARGWHECLDGQGRLSRSDMPSTSPYHLATCYQGVIAQGRR